MPPKIPYREEPTSPRSSAMSPSMRKTDKYESLGMGFSGTEKSIIDYGETLWNIIGNPVLSEGGLQFPYQRVDIPIGESSTFTAERGQGLYGQYERPDYNPEGAEKDLKFTLSKYF